MAQELVLIPKSKYDFLLKSGHISENEQYNKKISEKLNKKESNIDVTSKGEQKFQIETSKIEQKLPNETSKSEQKLPNKKLFVKQSYESFKKMRENKISGKKRKIQFIDKQNGEIKSINKNNPTKQWIVYDI